MDDYYQIFVEKEQLNNRLKMEPEDDDDHLKFDQHRKVVKQILLLVAKDSTSYSIRRMITFNRELFNCKRKDGESFRTFAERCRGVAQSYLSCLKRRPTHQEKQHRALVILKNARLPEKV